MLICLFVVDGALVGGSSKEKARKSHQFGRLRDSLEGQLQWPLYQGQPNRFFYEGKWPSHKSAMAVLSRPMAVLSRGALAASRPG